MSLLGPLRRQAGEQGADLARWIALTRWLISEDVPVEITAAAGDMVASIRRTLRGEPDRMMRGRASKRARQLAYDALDTWRSCGQPGIRAAAHAALRMISTQRRLARP